MIIMDDWQADILRKIKNVDDPLVILARDLLMIKCDGYQVLIDFDTHIKRYNLYEALIYAASREVSGFYRTGTLKFIVEAIRNKL